MTFNSRINNEAKMCLWAQISAVLCALLYYGYAIYRTAVVGEIAVAFGVQAVIFIAVIKIMQWMLPEEELFVGRVWLVVAFVTLWGWLYV